VSPTPNPEPRTSNRRIVLILALALFTQHPAASERAKGTLVVVGGGGTAPDIVARTIALAGGPDAIVVVLPQSSAEPDAGDSSVTMWREAGAKAARTISFDDRAAARAALNEATLIWMPGGDQNRFMKTIEGTGLDEIIRARYRAGAVVGGTSAGAAVLSAVMITGDADLQSVTSGRTATAPGLGLWREAIVDQHFLKRQRQNRLISAVIDHPDLVGVGIDEGTAVIVHGRRIEVVGRSAAVVVDARHARVAPSKTGGVAAATGMTVHVLRAGMSWDLR
jgi:cyanophycinase